MGDYWIEFLWPFRHRVFDVYLCYGDELTTLTIMKDIIFIDEFRRYCEYKRQYWLYEHTIEFLRRRGLRHKLTPDKTKLIKYKCKNVKKCEYLEFGRTFIYYTNIKKLYKGLFPEIYMWERGLINRIQNTLIYTEEWGSSVIRMSLKIYVPNTYRILSVDYTIRKIKHIEISNSKYTIINFGTFKTYFRLKIELESSSYKPKIHIWIRGLNKDKYTSLDPRLIMTSRRNN